MTEEDPDLSYTPPPSAGEPNEVPSFDYADPTNLIIGAEISDADLALREFASDVLDSQPAPMLVQANQDIVQVSAPLVIETDFPQEGGHGDNLDLNEGFDGGHPYFAIFDPEESPDKWIASFVPAYVNDLARKINHEVVLAGGGKFSEAKMEITDGTTLGVNIKTSKNGVIQGSPNLMELTGDEVTKQHAEETESDGGQDGDYWIKVVHFSLDDNDVMSADYTLDHNVMWEYRGIRNTTAGGDAYSLFKYSAENDREGYYILRSFEADGDEPEGDSETVSGDTKIYDVHVKPEEDGEIIKLSGKVELPDAPSVVTPETLSPMDGHKIATHNDGAGVIEDIDETVTTIAPYAGNSMSLSSDYFTYTDENGDETNVFFPDAGGGANYYGSDYIHVDNLANPPTIELANKNQATMKPVAGSVGFYEYYTVVSGALGHAAIYSTEPVDIGTSITQSSNTQETTGGTTSSP